MKGTTEAVLHGLYWGFILKKLKVEKKPILSPYLKNMVDRCDHVEAIGNTHLTNKGFFKKKTSVKDINKGS